MTEHWRQDLLLRRNTFQAGEGEEEYSVQSKESRFFAMNFLFSLSFRNDFKPNVSVSSVHHPTHR